MKEFISQSRVKEGVQIFFGGFVSFIHLIIDEESQQAYVYVRCDNIKKW